MRLLRFYGFQEKEHLPQSLRSVCIWTEFLLTQAIFSYLIQVTNAKLFKSTILISAAKNVEYAKHTSSGKTIMEVKKRIVLA